MFVGVDVLGDPQYTNFGRGIVSSADLGSIINVGVKPTDIANKK